MADATYTARATTKAHVVEGINKLTLASHHGSGSYSHDAIAQFVLGVNRVLRGTFCADDPGHGMESLTRRSTDAINPSKLSAIKSTDAANPDTILAKSAKEAATRQRASADPTIVIPPAINN